MDFEGIKKRLKDRAKPAPQPEPDADEAPETETEDESGYDLAKCFSSEQVAALKATFAAK